MKLHHLTTVGILILALAASLAFTGCGGGAAAPITQLTDFSIAAMAGGGYEQIVLDVLGIPRVAEGQEVYFWVGGASYPVGTVNTMGGFGAIGGAMGGGTITGSFYRNTATGRQEDNYIPTTIPFTEGVYMYRMYLPPNGDYLVTASFPFEGKTKTTPPLHFYVGPHYEE